MKKIKILQVITGLTPGGAERLVLDMVNLFDIQKYDIHLAILVDDLRALEVYNYPDQVVSVFDFKKKPLIYNLTQMRRFVNELQPDIIHAHMFHGLLASIMMKWLLIESPVVCFTSHNNKHHAFRRVIYRVLKKWRDADVVFASGQHAEINCSQTEIIANGVPVQKSAIERSQWGHISEIKLLSVGRLCEAKDPLGMIKSFARIEKANLILQFAGTGPLEQEMRILSNKLGVGDRVRFLGLCSEVRECMKHSDIFVMHSKWEGMPLALLEAGAEAMPVIATPVGAIPDILSDGRGWLAERDDFTNVMKKVVENPKAAIDAGEKLHDYILNNHSLQKTVKAHEELYLKLTNRVA